MTEPSRYPLAWPAHRPRKRSRRPGKFSAHGKPITPSLAISRLAEQAQRLGAIYPLLSSNLQVRLDGTVILNQGMPADPGVCLYFSLKGKPFALACDTYTTIEQNIAALAAHIDSMRAQERHGVATADESLQAFSALPPPSAVTPAPRPWNEVLGLMPEVASRETVEAVYRTLAKLAAGDELKLVELNRAKSDALEALKETT